HGPAGAQLHRRLPARRAHVGPPRRDDHEAGGGSARFPELPFATDRPRHRRRTDRREPDAGAGRAAGERRGGGVDGTPGGAPVRPDREKLSRIKTDRPGHSSARSSIHNVPWPRLLSRRNETVSVSGRATMAFTVIHFPDSFTVAVATISELPSLSNSRARSWTGDSFVA